MYNNKKCVTVFGSSIPKQGEDEYETAYKLGSIFAKAGLNVCSGGYHGIMDAVSKGCKENGGEALGVTFDIYNAIPSQYLSQELKCYTLLERLKNLIEFGDAYVVLQGGTGTLVELALVWEYMNKNMIEEKPFAAHGSIWKEIVPIVEKQIAKEKRKNGLVDCFNDIEMCGEFIIQRLL
ncbi:MAG: Rossmann fold nucleotide-binding protein [Ignavibacteria bacterium]|nr:MAG: Rossmann fold nucleotide-binding protein [Ignavibacteria bacterium]KAF0161858.1 MAG: Rossmann fold nucleotide-binding protein [Ignavibacteria bacterium]